jgi:hypothetical protein
MTELTPAEAQENDATSEYLTGDLAGTELRVKPLIEWRPSYLRALREGDFDTWAAGALHEDDVQAFTDADATFREITAFTSDVLTRSGEAPGKPSGPSRSSTRSRRK